MAKAIVGLLGSPRGAVSGEFIRYCQANGLFEKWDTRFFSGSEEGRKIFSALGVGQVFPADHFDAMEGVHILANCEREGWTADKFEWLRQSGFLGHFVDADSWGRGREDWTMLLQPLNQDRIEADYREGRRNWTGANCVTTEFAMAMQALYDADLVERVHITTDQATSGAGNSGLATYFSEARTLMSEELGVSLLDQTLNLAQRQREMPLNGSPFGTPIFNNHVPYIGSPVAGSRRSSEELKLWKELCAIYGREMPPAFARCRRAAVTRAHGMVVHCKLVRRISLSEIEDMLRANSSVWVRVYDSGRDESIRYINPLAVIGTPYVHIGRVLYDYEDDPNCTEVSFEVWFDQLLWGAAYPVVKQVEWLAEQHQREAA